MSHINDMITNNVIYVAFDNIICHHNVRQVLKMAHAATGKKQAKTFSLSEDVIEILEGYRRKKRVESLTSAVEQIVREWRKSDLAAQTTAYYDSLSDDEIKQDEQWGKFSESQM